MIEDDAWERIRRQIRRLEQTPRNTDRSGFQFQPTPTIDHRIGKANGAIPARSGTTPGSGSAIAWHVSTGSSLAVYGSSLSVYNLGAEIAADSYVVLHRHPQSGRWLVEVPQGGDNSTSTPAPLPPFPCYAVRNNGSQTLTKNTTATVVLDTQIHRYPDDATNFTLAANEVTVVERKVVSLKWGIHFTAISNSIAGSVWLEDNTTEIPRTRVPYAVGPAGIGHVSGTIDHVVSAANAEIRMRMSETANAENVSIWGDASNGYAYLDISVIRDH